MASRQKVTNIRAGRSSGRKNTASASRTYVDGNTVRSISFPVRETGSSVSEQTSRNRERSLQMNLGYVLFLTIAAVISVMVCVNYLKLQSSYTALQKEAIRMESKLNTLRIENDTEYNRIMSSINLEEIKETAIDRLGMVYINADQIETYNASGSDYVRQYMEIPDR